MSDALQERIAQLELIVQTQAVTIERLNSQYSAEVTQIRRQRDAFEAEAESQEKFNDRFAEKLKEFGTIDRLVESYSDMKMQLRALREFSQAVVDAQLPSLSFEHALIRKGLVDALRGELSRHESVG